EKPPGTATISVPSGSVGSLCQTRVMSAPAWESATARSRSQFDPGKVTTAAFMARAPAVFAWQIVAISARAKGALSPAFCLGKHILHGREGILTVLMRHRPGGTGGDADDRHGSCHTPGLWRLAPGVHFVSFSFLNTSAG